MELDAAAGDNLTRGVFYNPESGGFNEGFLEGEEVVDVVFCVPEETVLVVGFLDSFLDAFVVAGPVGAEEHGVGSTWVRADCRRWGGGQGGIRFGGLGRRAPA